MYNFYVETSVFLFITHFISDDIIIHPQFLLPITRFDMFHFSNSIYTPHLRDMLLLLLYCTCIDVISVCHLRSTI